MFTVKTRTKDRAFFFYHGDGVHEHKWHRENYWSNTFPYLKPGNYDHQEMMDALIENDSLSSVYVPPALDVKIYHHPGFVDESYSVSGKDQLNSFIFGGINAVPHDVNSSIQVLDKSDTKYSLKYNVINDYLLCNTEGMYKEIVYIWW